MEGSPPGNDSFEAINEPAKGEKIPPSLHPVPRLRAALLGVETGLSITGEAAAGMPALKDRVRPRGVPVRAPDSGRRMIVIAGQGADRGQEALRAVARWAIRSGRFPAVLDLSDTEPARASDAVERERGPAVLRPAAGDEAPGGRPVERPADSHAAEGAGGWPAERSSVPMATIPGGLEKLRDEPPELLAAVIDRLRRHELDADLLVARVPAHPRVTLMKAAFMAGGLVVPLDGSEQSLWEEFYLCQEVQQSFYGLTLWPWAADRLVLERFLTLLRNFLGIEAGGFDSESGDFAAVLGRLSAAPEEGFVAGLLAQGGATPPPHLLAITPLEL